MILSLSIAFFNCFCQLPRIAFLVFVRHADFTSMVNINTDPERAPGPWVEVPLGATTPVYVSPGPIPPYAGTVGPNVLASDILPTSADYMDLALLPMDRELYDQAVHEVEVSTRRLLQCQVWMTDRVNGWEQDDGVTLIRSLIHDLKGEISKVEWLMYEANGRIPRLYFWVNRMKDAIVSMTSTEGYLVNRVDKFLGTTSSSSDGMIFNMDV